MPTSLAWSSGCNGLELQAQQQDMRYLRESRGQNVRLQQVCVDLIVQCEGGFQNRHILSQAQGGVSSSESGIQCKSTILPPLWGRGDGEGGGFWRKREETEMNRESETKRDIYSTTRTDTHRQTERHRQREKNDFWCFSCLFVCLSEPSVNPYPTEILGLVNIMFTLSKN